MDAEEEEAVDAEEEEAAMTAELAACLVVLLSLQVSRCLVYLV